MGKSIHRVEYRTLVELLREQRERAGVTQTELSKALRRSQSFVSDVERGQRRLDVIELRDVCKAIGIELLEFVADLEGQLHRQASQSRRARRA